MTPRLIPALVLAPLAFLSPLSAQGRPVVRDTPNRPNIERRVEPQRASQDGQLNPNERERLIRAVRELRQQVDALQKKVDEMSSRSPRGPNPRPEADRGRRDQSQRADRRGEGREAPMAGRIADRVRAMRGGMMMRGPMQGRGMPMGGRVMRGQMLRGGMPMGGRNPMQGRMMQGEMPMPGFSPAFPMFGEWDSTPPQGEMPQRGQRGSRRAGAQRNGPQEIEVETLVIPEAGDEDVRVWVQGPDGLPGGQPMFLRQLMQGGGARGEDLPEPIRVMLQRRGAAGGEEAAPLRQRIRGRVLEAVEEIVEEVEEGEEGEEGGRRPQRRAGRRQA